MRRKLQILSLSAFVLLSFVPVNNLLNAQSSYIEDLKKFIKSEYEKFGSNNYDREKFLVGLMQLTNDEIQERIGNIKNAREKYFKSLKAILAEVQRIKPQLGGPGSALYKAAEDLEEDIQYSIDHGIVNKSQREAYREALQLLELGAQNPSLAASKARKESTASSPALESVKSALAGDQSVSSKAVKSGKVTVYTLFREWKNSEIVDYHKRLLDVEIIRKKLYKKANISQKQRMFKRELAAAYRSFNYFEYDFAARLLKEILNFYGNVSPKDDILYYLGEAYFAIGENEHAKNDGYLPIINGEKGSRYLPSALMRMVQISYNEKDFETAVEYAKKYISSASNIHRGYEDVLFLGGISAARNEDYDEARKMLLQIGVGSDYYYLARIIAANLYTVDEIYAEAEDILTKMVNTKKVPIKYRDQAILYLGISYYQSGQYDRAIYILKKISPEFEDWDLSNMVIAWSDYKRNLALKPSERDFSDAKLYCEMVLDGYYGTEYELEAKSLLAQIAEFEGKVDKAVEAFKNIEAYYQYRNAAGEFAKERDLYKKLKKKSQYVKNKALANENRQGYEKAKEIERRANEVLNRMTYSEVSSYGTRVVEEMKVLKEQAREAERLRDRALRDGNKDLAEKADKIALRLYRILNKLAQKVDPAAGGFNYFDATPVAKMEAEEERNNEKIIENREYIMQERENLLERKKKLRKKIEKAKRDGDYKTVVFGEIYLDEIDELLRKIDRLNTVAYATELKDNKSRVREWADFGAFGIVNSQIMEKDKAGNLQALLGKKLAEINDLLDARKTSIENKIFRIEEEIALLTRKVKEQRRRREREEKFREFEESYFERRESETEIEGAGAEIKDEETPIEDSGTESGEIKDIQDENIPENNEEIKDIPENNIDDSKKQQQDIKGDLENELNKLPGGDDEN